MDGEKGRTEAILESNIRSKDVDHGASWDVSPRGGGADGGGDDEEEAEAINKRTHNVLTI